jgi:pSer/pThr/pTyr-binding forkhead associated (FHA) protein
VKKQLLQNDDTIEIGKYKIKFVGEASGPTFEKTMILKAGMVPPPVKAPAPAGAAAPAGPVSAPGELTGVAASIKVLSGAAAGREVPLVKVVTTIGKPGVAVAAITKRPHGFVVAHVEGSNKPTVNGEAIGAEPVTLKNGDLLELAGTQMQFVQA